MVMYLTPLPASQTHSQINTHKTNKIPLCHLTAFFFFAALCIVINLRGRLAPSHSLLMLSQITRQLFSLLKTQISEPREADGGETGRKLYKLLCLIVGDKC